MRVVQTDQVETWTAMDGAVVLVNDDWRDERHGLVTIRDVAAIITDPPYGDATHGHHVSSVVLRNKGAVGSHLDMSAANGLGFDGLDLDVMKSIAGTFVATAQRWVVFTCEWRFVHALPGLVRMGIWRKADGAPQFTGDRPGTGWEAVAILHRDGKKRWNGGGRHAVWDVPKGSKPEHPTQKPLPLYESFVALFSDRGEVVADPYMGSGTTGVAAVRLGRRFVGWERDPKHFRTAQRRIAEAVESRTRGLFDAAEYRDQSLFDA